MDDVTHDDLHAERIELLKIEIQQRARNKALLKEAMQEVLKEWLDDRFAKFGRWSFYGIASAAFSGAVWLAALKLNINGP